VDTSEVVDQVAGFRRDCYRQQGIVGYLGIIVRLVDIPGTVPKWRPQRVNLSRITWARFLMFAVLVAVLVAVHCQLVTLADSKYSCH
jgi:hypothetical protein